MFDKKAYMKKYGKQYREAHKEEIKHKKHLYTISEKGKESKKSYYEAHKEIIKKRTMEYKHQHKDKVIAGAKRYYKEVRNPGIKIWEQYYGAVPKGCLIIHKNGNKNNNSINNLVLVDKGELGTMNLKELKISTNIEITKTNILLAQLMIKTYQKKKEETTCL